MSSLNQKLRNGISNERAAGGGTRNVSKRKAGCCSSYTIPSSSSPLLLSIQLIRYLSIHHSADPGPSNSKQSRFCVNARRTGPAYHTPMNYTTTDFNIIQIYV